MDPKTVTLIERPYQELTDDLLTAIVGGVVNEPIRFDLRLREQRYPLAQQARIVRGITGHVTRPDAEKPEQHTFQQGVDFTFDDVHSEIVWSNDQSATLPNDETDFYVDYIPQNANPQLTDINVGSVTRTLTEAIGREIATVYQQINQAYLSAFVDTATSKSLDFVVAILGIQRRTKDFATGFVTFFRDPTASKDITIAADTQLKTAKGEKIFETTELRTLQRGQTRIDVPVRATEKSKDAKDITRANEITEQVRPIEGISRVNNFHDMVAGIEDETDEQLRTRAKAALRALGKATIAALQNAIKDSGGEPIEVWDPNSAPPKQTNLGSVLLLVESEPESFPSLGAAVEETRAAGVRATLIARYVFFTPHLQVAMASVPSSELGQNKVKEEIIAALQAYVDGLSTGQPAKGEDLLKAIVKKAKFLDVLTARTDIGGPGEQALADFATKTATAILNALKEIADPEQQRQAIQDVLTKTPSLMPSDRRIPDRSLIKGPKGQPATDQEIETGDFQVVTVVDGENWWVALDITPADIELKPEAP